MLPVEQPFKAYTGLDGQPLSNGFVYFGLPNLDPITNPIQVYWDPAGTIPAYQPLRTMGGYLMNNGSPANVYCDSAYSELVQTKSHVQVFYARNSDDFSLSAYAQGLGGDFSKSSGASLIGFLQAGLGAMARTVQTKLREFVSATEFGAADDGLADDSAAESSALAQATKTRSIFRSLDMYKFPKRGLKTWKRTYGIKDKAAVVSITQGPDSTEPETQVLGFALDSDVSVYGDRDHVALFVQSTAMPPLVTAGGTTFTPTSVTSTSFAAAITAGSIKRGMLIDTVETPKKTGVVNGASGSTINVSGWYIVDGTRTTATPDAGTNVLVSPSTKTWALNANVLLPADAQANAVVGFELGLVNDKADGMGYLYDAVNLGSKKGGTAFQSRGSFIEGFHAFSGTQFGFISTAATSIGFYAQVGPVGFQSDGATAIAYLAKNSALALVVQDVDNNTKTILDGAGRWSQFKGKVNAFGSGGTIDGCYVAILTGTPVNLPDPSGNNAERFLYVQNSSAAPATAAGPIAGGGGGLVIAAGKCIQVVSNGSSWLPISQY